MSLNVYVCGKWKTRPLSILLANFQPSSLVLFIEVFENVIHTIWLKKIRIEFRRDRKYNAILLE